MTPVPQVLQCVVVGATSVQLRFDDGLAGILDLAPLLAGPIFGGLRDPARFREVTVEDGALVWPTGADICPSTLHYWCELGRVCSQTELDDHFAAAATPARAAESGAAYVAPPKP